MRKYFIAMVLYFIAFFIVFLILGIINEYTLRLVAPFKSVVCAMMAAILTPQVRSIETEQGRKVQVTSFIFKGLNFIY
jgi:hypothetical protein